ncbi:MAG: hypothetical protein M3Y87_26165 [Myxococcota bacterium]|nr:hypothetical protein [Myxococcota bacterium]
MAYRDEADALRARIEQLESELGALRGEHASLRGTRREDSSPRGLGERLLGGKVVIAQSRELDVVLSASDHDGVLDAMRSALGSIGETNVVGSTLAWRIGPPRTQRVVEVVISARDGRTKIRIVERLGSLAGGLFGGVVGGAGGGGLGVVVPLLAMFDPALAFVAAPAWVAGVYSIVRSAYGRTARRRERELASLMDELERTIRASARNEPPQVRVASAEDDLDRSRERATATPRAARQRD